MTINNVITKYQGEEEEEEGMVATFQEGIEAVLNVLQTNWNRGNSNNFKPVIIDIADTGPERGKRLDLDRTDYVLVFETAHNEELPELLYDFVTTRINITIDMRTARSRDQLNKMENELRRCIHLKRKGDGVNSKVSSYVRCS